MAFAATAAACLAAAELGRWLTPAGQPIPPFWPLAGVAVAVLWRVGSRCWPAVFIGALASALAKSAALPIALLVAAGSTMGPLTAVLLLRRLADFDARLERVRDVIGLAAAGALGSLVSATIIAPAGAAARPAPVGSTISVWTACWAAGLLGILLVAPLLLVWSATVYRWPRRREIAEGTALALLLVAAIRVVGFDADGRLSLLYPFLIWAALRFDIRGATLAVATIAAGAVWATVAGAGPLVAASPAETAHGLHLVLGVTAATGLVLGSATAERRRALDRWRGVSGSLRAVFEAHPVAIVGLDAAGLVERWSAGAERLFGWSASEVLGRPLPYVPGDRRAEHDDLMARQRRGEPIVGFETVRRHRSGRPLHISLSVSDIRDVDGRPLGSIGVVEDIGLRQQQKEILHTVFDHVPTMIVFADAAGRLRWVNRAWRERLGWSLDDIEGRDVPAELYPDPDERARMDRFARAAESQWGEFRMRTRGGEVIETSWAHVRLSDGTTIGVGQDMSERKEAERALRASESQLRQSQKMEAIGRLAGGVAHDFNNLLTSILGHTDLMLRELPADHDLREDIGEIQHAAERAADLTNQLLAFSRKQVIEPKVLDLNVAIGRIGGMLRRLIGEHIELAAELEPTLGRVLADPGQVEQVIVNLVVNARDAMPDGGRLRIATENVVLDQTFAETHAGAVAGPYVVLSVIDQGGGIDPEIQPHIFEPFYTTKDKSKGTGLGLATVYGIVKRSGGYIDVESGRGRGTTMRVYFPLAVMPLAAVPAPEEGGVRGTETILLVEDETSVRDLTRRILVRAGYTVLAARDADEALQRSAQYGEPVQLLLTDVIMAGLSGPRLAETLVRLRPGLKVLFMSGYNEDTIVRQGVLRAGVSYLQKPFTPSALTRRVRVVLDERERGLDAPRAG